MIPKHMVHFSFPPPASPCCCWPVVDLSSSSSREKKLVKDRKTIMPIEVK